jgi:hypothetical protein
MSEARIVIDHNVIRQWVEERGGYPASVKGTPREGEDAGILRIDFPGYSEESLERISWEEFFEKFEESRLAILLQDKTESGETSRFNKFVER